MNPQDHTNSLGDDPHLLFACPLVCRLGYKRSDTMELIVLGSGTGIPLSYRASPALAMIGYDNPVLFDMGPGTLRQLARIGINHDKIEQIFISHFHPDHTADLIHFLFATRNPPHFISTN